MRLSIKQKNWRWFVSGFLLYIALLATIKVALTHPSKTGTMQYIYWFAILILVVLAISFFCGWRCSEVSQEVGLTRYESGSLNDIPLTEIGGSNPSIGPPTQTGVDSPVAYHAHRQASIVRVETPPPEYAECVNQNEMRQENGAQRY